MAVAALAPYAAIAAAAVTAAGTYISAESQASQARYQAGVARNNQQIADYNAQVAAQKGQEEESAKRAQATQLIAAERAAAGASGIEANSGSPLKVQSDTARLGDIDAMTIRSNAAREVYGYKVAGLSYGGQAAADESAASQAELGGYLGAFGSIIGGGSTVAQKWSSWQTPSNPLTP